MAFRKKRDIFNTPNLSVPLDGSTALGAGEVLYRDTTNAVAKAATSSVGITTNLLGVTVGNPSDTATSCEIQPIVSSIGQLWEADCTNNTAANQLLKAQALTSSTAVANTSSHISTTLGVFIPVALVGAASDKKVLGYFAVAHQVTA